MGLSTPLRSARRLNDPIYLQRVLQWARWVVFTMHHMDLIG